MSDDLETRLRSGLAAAARSAPTGELLAERILTEVDNQPVRERHRPRRAGWRTWSLPLIAAASVAAVVGGLVGVSHLHRTSTPVPPAVTQSISPAPTPSPSSSSVIAPVPVPAPSPSTLAPRLTGFTVTDLSFVSHAEGWALGTANCLDGHSGTCSVLLHTTDGQHWSMITGSGATPFNVPGVWQGCTSRCVEHIRFADSHIGYAYGPNLLLLTTDGGQSWFSGGAGGASALEVADGTVLRIEPGSGPGLATLLGAATGSAQWQAVPLPATPYGAAEPVALARSGSDVAVQAAPQQAVPDTFLYWSSDDGRTWAARGAQCHDLLRLAVGGDGSLTEECTAHQGGADVTPEYVRTSTDGGATFGPDRTIVPVLGQSLVLVSASAQAILAWMPGPTGSSATELLVSGNGGQSWSVAEKGPAVAAAGFGPSMFLGCESETACRWAPAGSSTLWTSSTAGQSWSAAPFG